MDRSGVGIVGVAVIWATVIAASAAVLYDTPYWPRMLLILGGGAAASLIILSGVRYKSKKGGTGG